MCPAPSLSLIGIGRSLTAILSCVHGQVTFRYQNSKTRKMEIRTLAGADFLWLLLQHVAPKGFGKRGQYPFVSKTAFRFA